MISSLSRYRKKLTTKCRGIHFTKAETGQQSPRQCSDGNRHSDDGKPKDSVNQKIVKQSEPVVKNIMSGKIPKSADIKLSGRGFGSKSSVTSHAADSIPMGAVKMKDTGATADVGWEKSDNSEHFYVKFINWGTIYRPPQEFIYATGREADAELQKIAEQEYQSYLDNTLK